MPIHYIELTDKIMASYGSANRLATSSLLHTAELAIVLIITTVCEYS